MKPTVGRIVHYYLDASDHPLAAIVTAIPHADLGKDTIVNLAVFGVEGISVGVQDIQFSEVPARGCWNWPPRD